MREIKFRGMDIVNNKWLYGNLEIPLINQSKSKHFIIGYSYGQYQKHEVDPKTIGQYTGLKDCNGKEIFEGDIIKTEDNVISKVLYDEASYKCSFYHHDHLVNCILDNLFISMLKPVVIGNIYQTMCDKCGAKEVSHYVDSRINDIVVKADLLCNDCYQKESDGKL